MSARQRVAAEVAAIAAVTASASARASSPLGAPLAPADEEGYRTASDSPEPESEMSPVTPATPSPATPEEPPTGEGSDRAMSVDSVRSAHLVQTQLQAPIVFYATPPSPLTVRRDLHEVFAIFQDPEV